LFEKYNSYFPLLRKYNIKDGSIVIIQADFSPSSISLLLSLIKSNCIIVPVTTKIKTKQKEFEEISEAEIKIKIDNKDNLSFYNLETKKKRERNKLYKKLISKNHPGLVLFSSGSTGKSKGSVHDFNPLLNKFLEKRHTLRTVTFLLYDHIGGINTLFYILSNGGVIITLPSRSPDYVLKSIEKHRVELLPTSPTFLNLIILSESYKKYKSDSLKLITYGTEPMPMSTLTKLNNIYPNVKFLQTYGLSEVGILRSKSKSSNSLWFKVGGEGFKTRVVSGLLEIKAKSAMLGYLNAESPYTEDGWFKTGDSVEVKGDYIKILGRKSEIINIGGEKVYPQEVEDVILQIENVKDVVVYGQKNPILGNIVCADFTLIEPNENEEKIDKIIKNFCASKLERYKVPLKVNLVDGIKIGDRFKKQRLLR